MESKYDVIIREGYNFSIGKYLSKGWDFFKESAGSLIGYVLLYLIIAIVASLILNSLPFFDQWADYLMRFITEPLTAGFYIFFLQAKRQNEDFSNLFNGYKDFKEIAVYIIFFTLLSLPLYALMFAAVIPFDTWTEISSGTFTTFEEIIEQFTYAIGENLQMVFLASLIILVGFIYLYISYTLVLPLIVIDRLTAWKAMEVSRKIVSKSFFSFLGLFILMAIMGGIGTLLTCGLGLLVLIPWFMGISFAIYDDIIKPETEDLISEFDEFGKTDTDTNTEAEEN